MRRLMMVKNRDRDHPPRRYCQRIECGVVHSPPAVGRHPASSRLTQQTYTVRVVARFAGEEEEAFFELPYLGPNFNQFVTRAKK